MLILLKIDRPALFFSPCNGNTELFLFDLLFHILINLNAWYILGILMFQYQNMKSTLSGSFLDIDLCNIGTFDFILFFQLEISLFDVPPNPPPIKKIFDEYLDVLSLVNKESWWKLLTIYFEARHLKFIWWLFRFNRLYPICQSGWLSGVLLELLLNDRYLAASASQLATPVSTYSDVYGLKGHPIFKHEFKGYNIHGVRFVLSVILINPLSWLPNKSFSMFKTLTPTFFTIKGVYLLKCSVKRHFI